MMHLGELVKELINNRLSQGYYSIKWNGTNYSGASVGSGIYIYKLTMKAGNEFYSQSHKMNLVK